MSDPAAYPAERSRLAVLLEHLGAIEDPRDVRRITHPLSEVLLLAVCGTIAGCDDYEHIAEWGAAHLGFLRRHLPYEHGEGGKTCGTQVQHGSAQQNRGWKINALLVPLRHHTGYFPWLATGYAPLT